MSARRRAARWSGLRGLDERLMSRSADARSKILDGTLVALTRAASYSRLWLLIAGVLAFSGRERARRAAADGLLATAIAAVIVNGPAKLLVRRRRPSRPSSPPLIVMPHTSSFPSGHSASAFAFATGASCAWPLLAPALLPLATTVAYSRVHAGVHYPTDVAAGAAIGAGAGLIASRLRRAASRTDVCAAALS